MSETTNTAMDVGENIGARVLSSVVIRPTALEQGEDTVDIAPTAQPQDHGERFAQLLEYCESPGGTARKISKHSKLIVLVSNSSDAGPSEPNDFISTHLAKQSYIVNVDATSLQIWELGRPRMDCNQTW